MPIVTSDSDCKKTETLRLSSNTKMHPSQPRVNRIPTLGTRFFVLGIGIHFSFALPDAKKYEKLYISSRAVKHINLIAIVFKIK